MKKEYAQLWYDALISGKYTQSQGCLKNTEGMCCLGVLIDITKPEGWTIDDTLWSWEGKGDSADVELPLEICELVGADMLYINLKIPSHFQDRKSNYYRSSNDISVGSHRSAVSLNDTFNFTFEEIAECVKYSFL